MNRSRLAEALFVLTVVSGSMRLLYLVDDRLGLGWVQNVLQNWQDTGLVACKGRLAYNPGGFEAMIRPLYYSGMSPVGPALAYGISRAFAWTSIGLTAFHAHRHRFAGRQEYRNRVCQVLIGSFFQKFVPPEARVLDLGCGYGG